MSLLGRPPALFSRFYGGRSHQLDICSERSFLEAWSSNKSYSYLLLFKGFLQRWSVIASTEQEQRLTKLKNLRFIVIVLNLSSRSSLRDLHPTDWLSNPLLLSILKNLKYTNFSWTTGIYHKEFSVWYPFSAYKIYHPLSSSYYILSGSINTRAILHIVLLYLLYCSYSVILFFIPSDLPFFINITTIDYIQDLR